ncbi:MULTISPECIES: carboxylesterase family protein [unclassified Mycolicibacterium]|uniref:carboxylesterase family protein n=1 Tax=unclassified Mycolicibacterium TaxID=2636767 RepID=UPI0012DFD9F4|nr:MULTISPECIES: carboxylesterase family protein [unclassified Mycolicibacterium]MUL84273.1 carboxylesterase family protein [Mycolicibacterium sp. CBMA 329]MUL89661.1 carboxylesterase family protein [Mycolicibacterium sp. CBMA 331]MUL99836.1 carboxylesterase family protein [Mycolicibacterium sp. CBMA 334]MUM28759.1 carboxylesterase family protein [Mycolicibacterium sp. CBMA 295]MUM39176.1 carboxylesterase family protein [Mycolicibacterium sp. CBMA 247]
MTERRISGGVIRVEEHDGLVRARGIPYGSAARFQPSQPASWSGVLDATRPGAACPQRPSRLAWVTGAVLDGLSTSEDCLVVTVTAPADADGLPVMVWFHGGAYVAGSGESAKYDAGRLVRDGDVVVVNVSYRLGIFGYLAPPDAGGEDNLGLRDQILALRWVRDNIAAFGGDPANVTAFGQSAGGHSVWSLMLSDEAEGLFHRAIAQSAPLGLGDDRDALVRAMREAMATSLGPVSPAEATVEQLLQAEAEAVAAAQPFGLLGGLPFAPLLGRRPSPDAADVPDRIADAAGRIELLVGYTREDAAPFAAMFGQAAGGEATEALTKLIFGAPTEELAATWTRHGGRAVDYRFDWTPESAPLGACHCMELPFLFGSAQAWSDAEMLGPARTIDKKLGLELRTRWTQFAHHGVESLPAGPLVFG